MNYRNLLLGIPVCTALLAADPTVEQARKNIAEKKYDEAITQLETANKAKPNAEVKKALADAYLAKADSIMADQNAQPRMKYPAALHAYREVLKYDSANQKAKDQIAQIESIYKFDGPSRPAVGQARPIGSRRPRPYCSGSLLSSYTSRRCAAPQRRMAPDNSR